MNVIDELTRLEAFARVDPASRQLLEQGLVCQHLNRAAAVLHKGQPVSGAYIVLDGRLRVFTITPGGTEATIYFVNPGDTCVLALNCLFNDLLYPAWVQAEEATRIVRIPGAVYRQLHEREADIRNLTVQTLSTLVWRLMSELEQLHACTHRQRLANFILQHASSDGELRMTQQVLARHLGTTREVVARLVQEFVGAGLLRTGRGRLYIADLFGLRRVVTER
ncbi:MAG: Crp/Fnr family transcriptional regulator [Xanthomonadales bacterium]|nr:Crp/Fnr family transcriptional regulator [Xanthomonadales bacterium]